MTLRARYLALAALLGLCIAIARGQSTVGVLCLVVLIWIVWEWATFLWYTTRELECLRMVRKVNGREQDSGVLWAGQTIHVDLQIDCLEGKFRLDRRFRDVLPENLQLTYSSEATARKQKRYWWTPLWEQLKELVQIASVEIGPNESMLIEAKNQVQIQYSAKVLAAGEVALPGVRIQFADPWKFFHRDRFIDLKQTYQVLPSFVALKDASPILKRINTIPRQGIHRQQKPGIGFELLELREYVDGDPPKSIAWKASARRDKLMSRQYESEVPVRVQLILDGTASTRLGGYGLRLIDQITSVAATVAHSVTHSGDAIGAYLVDESSVENHAATSGEKGFFRLLQAMGKFSVNREPQVSHFSQSMVDAAYSVLSERYPELLDPKVNPITLASFPFLITRNTRQRIQLAGALAELYRLSSTLQTELTMSPMLLASYTLRFLCESGMPWMSPVVSTEDISRFRSVIRARQLAKAMHSAIARARDNEVMIVVAELLGALRDREELIDVLKIAKAKHHRVAVICPSPTFLRPMPNIEISAMNNASDLRQTAEHIRLKELMQPLARTLAKISVPIAMSGETKAMRMVLSEIEIARTGRVATRGALR